MYVLYPFTLLLTPTCIKVHLEQEAEQKIAVLAEKAHNEAIV